MIVLWQRAVLGTVCLIFGAVLARPLLAHGGGTPQLTNAEVGPYRVFAWTDPEPWRAGDVHITIAVTLPPPDDVVVDENLLSNTLDEPVDDAQVTVRLAEADDRASIRRQASLLNSLGGIYYEADMRLPSPGEWEVAIDVAGPLGTGTAAFAIEALPARSINWLWLALGAVALVALVTGFGLRSRQSEPRAVRRQGATGAK